MCDAARGSDNDSGHKAMRATVIAVQCTDRTRQDRTECGGRYFTTYFISLGSKQFKQSEQSRDLRWGSPVGSKLQNPFLYMIVTIEPYMHFLFCYGFRSS